MSTISYIPGQRVISFDANGQMIKEDTSSSDDADKSLSVMKSLRIALISNDFEQFKNVYENQYISDSTIYDYFHFGDQGPYDEYNTYSLCSCPNRYDEPEYINKYLSVRPCCCVGGKRYLAYNLYTFIRKNYYPKDQVEDEMILIKQYLLDDGPIDLNYVNMVDIRK